MTKTENQLRDALTGIAALVQPKEQRAEEPRRRRAVAWLAPAAVATAVLLVIVAGAIAASLQPSRHNALGSYGPARFFLSMLGPTVSVREMTTGGVTTVVPKPKDIKSWNMFAATGDDRLFFLTATQKQRNTPFGLARLYRLRLDRTGKIADLARIKNFSHSQDTWSMAASPDGQRVALAVQDWESRGRTPTPGSAQPFFGPATILVVDVASGHRQKFSSSQTGLIDRLSWSDDGRRLAFQKSDRPDGRDGIYVFDLRTGRDLLKDAHRVTVGNPESATSPVLSADGSKIYYVVNQGRPVSTQLVEADVATGTQLRVLYQQPLADPLNNCRWMFSAFTRDVGGNRLMVYEGRSRVLIDLGTGRLSWPPSMPEPWVGPQQQVILGLSSRESAC